MLILECPNCQSCFTVEQWNESLGFRDEPIPLDTQDWDAYTSEHSGRVDCPECGDVAIYEDMMAV
jgi:endogenous inhibitor of DNA gyrase (YacG/DUF329 family)